MSSSEQEQLVERIVREVLARLDSESDRPPPDGPRVAVVLSASVSPSVADLFQRLDERGYVLDRVGPSFQLPASVAETLRPWLSQEVTLRDRFSADTVALLAPELALADVAKLTLGILDDVPPAWIWTALASRLPVYASPGEGFGTDLPAPLKRIAEEQRALSERLGIRWAERGTLHRALAAQVRSAEPVETVHLPSVSGRLLITEAMVQNLAEGTRELVVPPSAILTPLARDLAQQRGIRIRYRSR